MTEKIQHRVGRLKSRVEELMFWRDAAVLELRDWRIDGRPIRAGEGWPDREGIKRFEHAGIGVPAGWPVEAVFLVLDLGGEGLVRIRYADGSEEGFGHDVFHHRFPLQHREFSIEAEVVGRLAFGRPNRDPRLEQARLVLTDKAVERLALQLSMVIETIETLGEHDVSGAMVAAAERAVASLDWPSSTEIYDGRIAMGSRMRSIWEFPPELERSASPLSETERSSALAASRSLQAELVELQAKFPPEGNIAVTGHAHIDLAWLWPMEETRRKAQRTFYTALALMERYPEFRFNQSSAQLYAFLERDDPDLFARIKEKVADGQWEPVGGMWVEPDSNMPSGESLVRQLLYGQRYFESRFGRKHRVCWLPDCFGFTPALPQILTQAGIDRFFTIKLTWSETNRFPYDLFRWEGIDGTRVLAHMFSNPAHEISDTAGYNGNPTPFALLETWRNFGGKEYCGESLLSIGYGDGGGGVTREMLEQGRELESFPVVPSARFSHVEDFFDRMEGATVSKELPIWVGELYLELHRGTLTTQGRTKRLHRQAERDLVTAEVLGCLSRLASGPAPASLEEQWRILLRNEFHDILPGSSIHEVYQTAEQELQSVIEAAAGVIDTKMADLESSMVVPGNREGILVVNPDLTPRPLRLVVDAPVESGQPVEEGVLLTSSQVVSGLAVRLWMAETEESGMSVSAERLENRFIRVTLGPDGTLMGVYDKRTNREVLADRGNQLWAYVDKPRAWDAWDVDAGYIREGREIIEVEAIEVVEEGPHRVAVRIARRFRNSLITQDVRLWANSPRIDFKTTIDWHDRRWLLKALFPLAIRADYATFETAFGVVRRSTHRNTTWEAAQFEVAAHRFADLSEAGYGVALLNDGKYGHHAFGNELGISLLRSPVYPDPLADEGRQTFTYSLLPHRGDWWEDGQVLMEAEDLNRPLIARVVRTGQATLRDQESSSRQLISVNGLRLGMGCLKPAEDWEGLVLRVYEPSGARGPIEIEVPDGWRVGDQLNLLEETMGEGERELKPFQIRTWALIQAAGQNE